MKKSFTKMKTQIEELEDQSDISDRDELGSMFLQVVDMRSTVLKYKHNMFLNNEKETRSGALTKPLSLREVFLLNNQSNVYLDCNSELVEDIHKVKIGCKIGGTGGTIRVMHKAIQKGYNHKFWFDDKAIANIYALCNFIEKYRVSYDSAKSTSI